MPPARALMADAGQRARDRIEERLTPPESRHIDSLFHAAETADDPHGDCRRIHEIRSRVLFHDSTGIQRSLGDFCAGTTAALRARPRVNSNVMSSLGDWDVRRSLGSVQAPVLIVHGAESSIPADQMHEWARSFPLARLVTIPQAGHYLYVDRPDAFFPVAEAFLRGVWPAEAIVVRTPLPSQ